MSRVTVSIEMEFSGSGSGWTAVSDVLAIDGVRATRGIPGNGPMDCVAEPGTLSFTLNNSGSNSGSKQGYYSPNHSNCRSGFGIGIGVRLRVTHLGTTRTRWVGKLDLANPIPGKYRDQKTACVAVDFMDEMSRSPLQGLSTQTSIRSDQVISAIIAAMPNQPAATSYDTGKDTYDYALDNTADESATSLSETQRVCQSELGKAYLKADGTFRFENRHARASVAVNATTFNETMVDMKVSRARADILNKVKTIVHPRRVDPLPTRVLWTLQSTPLVQADGVPVTYYGGYVDPDQRAVRVGATDLQAVTASTDYTMNSAANGSGTDLTANFTVTPVLGGNSVFFTITNNGTEAGYITKLQVRGRGLYDYEPATALATDSASVTAYGQNVISVDMYYQSDGAIASGAGAWILATYKDPLTAVHSVTVVGTTDALITQCLTREISDRIGLVETVTGISNTGTGSAEIGYYINGVIEFYDLLGTVTTTWSLAPGERFAYWILDTVGASELDVSTRLGYI